MYVSKESRAALGLFGVSLVAATAVGFTSLLAWTLHGIGAAVRLPRCR